jgi:hypothetical protein
MHGFVTPQKKVLVSNMYSVVTIRSHQYMQCAAIAYLYKLVAQPTTSLSASSSFKLWTRKLALVLVAFAFRVLSHQAIHTLERNNVEHIDGLLDGMPSSPGVGAMLTHLSNLVWIPL